AAVHDDPTAAYKARLATLQSSGIGGAGGSASSSPQLLQTATASGRNNVAQFGNGSSGSGEQGDRWQLDSRLEAPRSPFELRAGFVIPGTLISGINSELPGQLMAQVAQNVYDTPTGKHLLIPQGSRLVGRYSSDVAYGQARVLVAWQRIVFPDGKAIDIGAMPGADGIGYAGFTDQVNNHYLRLFGSALLMSAVTAGITYSQGQNQGNSVYGAPTASSAMSEALGQQLGQVTAQLIAKNMNIAPTLEIRPGYRFNVIVTKDMTFSKPYQSFDY
ncbi:MAG: TrbI/VirB10 family protein, partial [Accumulibacter sp.]|uniref:TrbI/VirB10 family protein n=1 Tax=Accumulibacter sp. TaxID=2053492 RepID=UPI003314FA51